MKTWSNGSPKYFKLSTKESNSGFSCEPFDILKVRIANSKNLVIVNGHLIDEVLKVDDCDVILCSTLSELKESASRELIKEVLSHENVFTVEENSVIGGLGDMVFDIISQSGDMPRRFKKIGIPRKFLTNYGTADQHRDSLGLNCDRFRVIIESGV
jgi:transketolase C-terminal domain/subunit